MGRLLLDDRNRVLCTASDIAHILGVTVRRARGLIKNGEIPGFMWQVRGSLWENVAFRDDVLAYQQRERGIAWASMSEVDL